MRDEVLFKLQMDIIMTEIWTLSSVSDCKAQCFGHWMCLRPHMGWGKGRAFSGELVYKSWSFSMDY